MPDNKLNGAPGTSRRQVIEGTVFTAKFPLLPSALIPLPCTTVQSHSSKDDSASKPRRLANQFTMLIERAASRSPFGTTCVSCAPAGDDFRIRA